MLWVVGIVLGLLWALAMANSYSAGGYIHVLMFVAVGLLTYGIYRRQRERRHAS
jgi:hypothetical protein